MKKRAMILAVLMAALSLSACTSESTSTTTINVETTTDEGTKEYSYKSENHNGEVTTETNVTETPAADNGAEEETDAAEEVDAGTLEEAEWLDSLLTEKFDDEDAGHRVTYNPKEIYVSIWQKGITGPDDVNEEEFRSNVLESWVEATKGWKEQFEEDGNGDVYLSFQYIADDESQALFTIEDGEVTYFVFDE